MVSVAGRVAIATILALPVSGLSAALASVVSSRIFPLDAINSLPQPAAAALLFSTFGAIVLLPATLVSQAVITVSQSRLDKPSAIFQLIGSALLGVGISSVFMLAGKNTNPAQGAFSILTGLVGGAGIGGIWFLLVTAPTHQSRRDITLGSK